MPNRIGLVPIRFAEVPFIDKNPPCAFSLRSAEEQF